MAQAQSHCASNIISNTHPFHSKWVDPPIPELQQFQNFTLKIQGKGHGWGGHWKSEHGSNILSTHIPLIPCQSASPFLRYDFFKIWPWKFKVKVMGEGKVESHNMGPTFYQLTSLSSVLPKVFWAPVLRTSGSWNLPVRMEGSLVRNFNNYYVLLIHVFDGCSNRFDLCDHFNLVCCCLSPVLISDKRSCWKISQSLKPKWLDVEMLVPLFKKINQCCRDACQISEQLEDSKRLSEKLRQDFLCHIESAPRLVQCSVNSSLIVLDK